MRGVTQVSAHTFEIGGDFVAPETVPVLPPVRPAVPAFMAPPAAPAAPPPVLEHEPEAKPLTAKQLLARMRARLKVVERELAAKALLEQERDQLQRLIRAATTEIDNVRRLRSAG